MIAMKKANHPVKHFIQLKGFFGTWVTSLKEKANPRANKITKYPGMVK
jgi:hypothetical protein